MDFRTTIFCDMTPYSVEVIDISKELAEPALLWQDVGTRLHGVRTQIFKTLIFAAIKKRQMLVETAPAFPKCLTQR
jgi:hypothetical protein